MLTKNATSSIYIKTKPKEALSVKTVSLKTYAADP